MKRIIFISLLTITIFLVGCNTQNNEKTVKDPTQDERLVKNGLNVEIAGKDYDLILGEEVNEEISELIEKQRTILTYDEGHQQLQKVIDELYKHADDLADLVPVNGKGDYIGFTYATYNLYNYLLAIYYKGEDLLDSNYPYNYSFDSFNELTETYHEHVDFNTIELEELNHKNYDIEIKLSYKNKNTNKKEYLKFFISYSKHGLMDLSDFNL